MRHPDNWLFVAMCASIAVSLLWSGPRPMDLAWLTAGLLIFLPQEYFAHVYILHAKVPRTERRYRWMYRLHYGHHDLPKRHDLMYMPLWFTVPMTLGNMALIWAITPDGRAFWACFCGALGGYVFFEWAHLLCHVPYVPKLAILRRVRNRHLLHHFFNEQHWYSVAPTTLFMDRLMGTDGERSRMARTDTCRYLGLNGEHPWVLRARAHFAAGSSGGPTSSRLWIKAAPGRED